MVQPPGVLIHLIVSDGVNDGEPVQLLFVRVVEAVAAVHNVRQEQGDVYYHRVRLELLIPTLQHFIFSKLGLCHNLVITCAYGCLFSNHYGYMHAHCTPFVINGSQLHYLHIT